MSFVSVCKNVIAKNNKNRWQNPEPTLRVSNTPSGKVVNRSFGVGIVDKDGNVVARLVSTDDGTPIIKCGAKVALITDFDVVDLA